MASGKRYGIRLKITLAFALVFTLLSILLNLYSYRKIRELIIADHDRYLLSRANSLLDKTEVSPVIIPLPDQNSSLKVFARNFNGTKTQLFTSPGPIGKIFLPRRTGVSDTLGLRIAYVSNSSDENPAELMLAVSSSTLQATLQYLLLLLLLCTLVSVLISGLISFWLARFFLKPLQQIINKTKSITAGHLQERVPVKQSQDELQVLAETINEMLQRIDLSLQQQQNFFASASHELKTPLAIMRAEMEVNLKRSDTDEMLASLLSSQLTEIGRLQKIVEEFLLIGQIKAGRLQLHCERFELSESCMKIAHQLKPLCTDKGLTITIQLDEEMPVLTLMADKEKIRIVLTNILINAIKYSIADTVIEVKLTFDADQEQVLISTQNAIRQPTLDTTELTTAFYRNNVLDNGAGVGLWLCREIIEAHRGKLELAAQDHLFKVLIRLPHQA